MAGLIGKKIGMTSMFSEEGKNIPCTIIEAGPCTVTQIKTEESDGYSALQIAFDNQKDSRLSKALLGHLKKAGAPASKKIAEISFNSDLSMGDTLNVDLFAEGDFVTVVGNSKDKGFQCVVKSHGFAGGGNATHGQHNRLRAPGSIGAASYPARVFKGMRMAGQMGNARVKVENLQVMRVMSEKNIMIVKGAVPGAKNSYIIIEK